MIVSASGDESNVTHIAAGDAIPEWRLVPHDNNIGQRNVAPVPGGTTGLVEEFDQLSFLVKNPLTRRASVLLEAVLPSMLRERDWSLAFASAGGNSFALEPGESRDVVMRLTRGKDFTPSDVEAAGDPAIAVQARMDGIVVGGMTYRLDPTLDRPNRPHGGPNPAPGEPGHRHDDQCGCDRDDAKLDRMTELLLDALASRPQRVREVEVKKVILEIELEDC